MHRQWLEKLLDYSDDLDTISRALKPFGFDFDEPVEVLSYKHVVGVLERYLNGSLTAQHLEDWGNAIEGREDIGYEKGYEDVIGGAIHHLANPLLTEPISEQSVRNILGRFL